MRQDEQLLDTSSMPGDGCPAAAAAALTSSSPGYVLEADGACGLFRTRYPPAQRIALRKWVVSYVSQAPGQHGAASSNSSQGLDVQQLLAASKILQDQAVLSLSAFGEVPGAEMWAVLQAAVNASLAASHYSQQAPVQAGSFVQDGFGTVLYSLLAPLLPSVEVLLDRLAAARSCWLGAQVGGGSPLLSGQAQLVIPKCWWGVPRTACSHRCQQIFSQHVRFPDIHRYHLIFSKVC